MNKWFWEDYLLRTEEMKRKTLKSSAEDSTLRTDYKGDISNMEGKHDEPSFKQLNLNSLKIYSLLWDTVLLILTVCKTVVIKPAAAFYGLW